MTIYAVIENNVVINRIVAESKEIAESVTGKTCIECDGTSVVGGYYLDGVFAGAINSPDVDSETPDGFEITDSI